MLNPCGGGSGARRPCAVVRGDLTIQTHIQLFRSGMLHVRARACAARGAEFGDGGARDDTFDTWHLPTRAFGSWTFSSI